MAAPTIPNGEEYFFNILYEGNQAGQRVGKFVPFTDNGTIANSVIFNNADNAYVSKTFGTPTNNKKWTLSAWVKLGVLGTNRALISSNINGAEYFDLFFTTGNVLKAQNRISSSNDLLSSTSRTFEDTSKFYHFLIVYDSDNSTSADRYIVYVDGDRLTVDDEAGSGVASAFNKSGVQHQVGISNTLGSSGVAGLGYQFDGYMAEVNFVDGSALTPSTFGLTDTSTGRWIPKALTGITYGNNGFRLQFASSSDFGDDSAGSNDFSVTNLVPSDQTTDSPTQNHATMNPSNKASTNASLSEGNLTVTQSNTYGGACAGMALPSSGKYYWEIKSVGTMDGNTIVGIVPDNGVTIAGSGQFPGGSSNSGSFGFAPAQTSDAQTVRNSVFENCPTLSKTTNAGTYIQMCWDGDTGSLWFGLNDTFEGNPSAGTGASFTGINNTNKLFPACFAYADVFEFNFGQRSFQYTPPTGFVALQQDNLSETSKGVTGFSWIKNRDTASNHQLYDSSRGAGKLLMSSATNAESTRTDALYKFLKGGYAVGDNSSINGSGDSIVAWNWTGNNGTTVTNDASATGVGDIDSVYQANTTAGFSIVTYTGTGSAGGIAHGLGKTPRWVMTKSRSNNTSDGFSVLHGSTGTNFYDLSKTNAGNSNTVVWNAVPTSTVFNVGSATGSNNNGYTYVAYCWAEIEGFSKFGSYTGNCNADGPFIYTGFKPAWVMYKQTNTTNYWAIFDSKRSPHNVMQNRLAPNYNLVEDVSTLNQQDFLSNGFKLRGTDTTTNQNGGTYIYMAFAEHPFVGDGTNPVTAR